jgi:hypothetical protein
MEGALATPQLAPKPESEQEQSELNPSASTNLALLNEQGQEYSQ